MRVLVTMRNGPPHVYLVKLHGQNVIDEVMSLIDRQKHSQAIVTAMTKGSVERVVYGDEMKSLRADLVLSRNNALWDLT